MIRDLLQLARAPLAASAVSNVLLGLALARPAGPWTERRWAAVALLVLATACLYWAGMVLNDWFDRERDARLQPRRPIPAGRVDPGVAVLLGVGLLGAGLLLGGLSALWAGAAVPRGVLAAGLVAFSVLAYDGWLKRYRVVGSLAMASCRVTNVLMPALVFGLAATGPLLVYLGLLGLYITCLTLVSTYEDEDAPGIPLAGAFLGCLAAPGGLALLALTPQGSAWALLGAVPLGAVVLTQLALVMGVGSRRRGGAMTRALLKSIWLLDLGVILLAGVHWLLPLWGGLYGLGWVGVKLLFGPPPAAASE